MIIFDEWTEKYEKAFPDGDLAIEYFGENRRPKDIAMLERAFRENKPLTELYPDIKEFVRQIRIGNIKT